MKKILLLYFLGMVVCSIFAQTQYPPSTVGQIYNFNVGDTLEYSTFSGDIFDASSGRNNTTIIYVVTSYINTVDSISYSYEQYESRPSNPGGPNSHLPFGIFFDSITSKQTLYSIDSSIFLNVSSTYLCQGYTAQQCYDSVYYGGTNNYNSKKLNEHNFSFGNSDDVIWADSLGLVHERRYFEGQPSTIYIWDLIYYHKIATNETWGQLKLFPSYSVYLGVNDIVKSEIKLSPNPVKDKLNSNLDLKNYTLTIYDMTGRQLSFLVLNNIIDVSAFPLGVYSLYIKNESQTIVRKFLKE